MGQCVYSIHFLKGPDSFLSQLFLLPSSWEFREVERDSYSDQIITCPMCTSLRPYSSSRYRQSLICSTMHNRHNTVFHAACSLFICPSVHCWDVRFQCSVLCIMLLVSPISYDELVPASHSKLLSLSVIWRGLALPSPLFIFRWKSLVYLFSSQPSLPHLPRVMIHCNGLNAAMSVICRFYAPAKCQYSSSLEIVDAQSLLHYETELLFI